MWRTKDSRRRWKTRGWLLLPTTSYCVSSTNSGAPDKRYNIYHTLLLYHVSAVYLTAIQAFSLYCKQFAGPKNQSFRNNTGKPQPIADQIWYICTAQAATVFRKVFSERHRLFHCFTRNCLTYTHIVLFSVRAFDLFNKDYL